VDGGIRWLFNSDVCKHCTAAPCQEACPTGALIYNEFGNVYVQQDVCNGCGYCVSACPFGVLGRSKSDGAVHKCTLCYDRQRDGLEPACAKACPTGSIQFGPISRLHESARQRVAHLHAQGQTSAYLYGADDAGEYERLNAFFLLTEEPAAYNLPPAPRRPSAAMLRRYLWAAAAGIGLSLASAVALATGGGD
jgi:formate dehydrogenase iron-sulfur subunit